MASNDPHSVLARARRALAYFRGRLSPGPESSKASRYWGGLVDYHLSNDDDPVARARSQWLAEDVVPQIGATSLWEIGTNSGRNLEVIRSVHPTMRLKGTDVNPRAVEFAQAKGLDIEFALADANEWTEPERSWDAVLTMSVLDHIPDDATEALAANVAKTSRHVITVELWDGSAGSRGVYKYSRDNQALFERHGYTTLRWEVAPGQYDEEKSRLWVYVGRAGWA
jgi:protein-L-isoaspartate O-methyltransferase